MVETRVRRAGLAYGLIKYMSMWVLGSLLWIVLNELVQPMRQQALDLTKTAYAEQGIQWIAFQAWDWAPLWLGLLAMVMILRRSVTESRRPV